MSDSTAPIRAIDAVVNIWTEEALSVRPDWGDDFFVGKMKAQNSLMPGLTLDDMAARMNAGGSGHGFLIAAKSGRVGLPGCYHIPGPYLYRNPFSTDDPAELARLSAGMLEREISFQGANTVAAFVMEPVQGAGGVIPPHPSFMPMVRDICDKHGVLLIADEVITAFGRTGDETGSRHWGVQPDLMCTAKAITNGYFPFGAVMISDRVAAVFEDDETGAGSVDQGYTYSGHPVGAAAAVAALEETMRIRPWENARVRGTQLKAGLDSLAERHDMIGDVRGEGLMCAIELVSDRTTKVPVGKALPLAFQKAAYEEGVMIRVSGNNAIFSPPLVVDAGHVDKILSATETGLRAMAEVA